jgi:hypothetical protein
VYGNYCWWSWFRYFYLDSCNLVTMMLVDKGYYDYDFEKTKAPVSKVTYNWEDTIKSDEEVDGILAMFGMSAKRTKPKTDEEIQSYILKQMEEQ